jgi:hypothetical protein
MTEVPKIVHDRLRTGLPDPAASGAAHPDADLLTAFAEQVLSGAERDDVLGHLALCVDCREVVALTLPAETVAAPAEAEMGRAMPSVKPPERSRLAAFAWTSLPWAALAAGVALAASVLLLRSDNQNVARPSPANPPVAATAQPTPVPRTAPPTDKLATLARTDVAKSRPELSLSKKLKAGQGAAGSVPAESGILIADNKIAGNKKDSVQADKPAAVPPARAFNYDAFASRKTTESVEVSAAAIATEATPADEVNLMARNEAPAVEKAKLAPQGLETDQLQKTQAAAVPGMARSKAMNGATALKLEPAKPALARNVTWTITEGVLQRSLDSGHSWQNAVHADHPLLCYASHDQDIWTGGEVSTLFHSADGGLTWVQVQPSIKAQPLSADITQIEVRGPTEVVVSTNNNETWSTADGGKTWQKK